MNYKTTLHILVLCALIPILGFAQTSTGKRIYVSKSATAGSEADGQSWSTAFGDLQHALSIVKEGDSIWIAEGKYYPAENDRNKTFNIPSGIKLFGGFKGVELTLNGRDWINHPSILSGEIGNIENKSDNSIHVVTMVDPDTATIIDGLIIEKGRTNYSQIGPSTIDNWGGGLLISINQLDGGVKIKNCVFRENSADLGGGIAVIENKLNIKNNIQIGNCIFQSNIASSGGAVALQIYGTTSKLSIDKCRFELNSTSNSGAAIWHTFAGDVSINKCTFDRNQTNGSGIIKSDNINSFIEIADCDFLSDYLAGGGVIEILSLGNPTIGVQYKQKITIQRNRFSNTKSPFDGGSIYFSQEGKNLITEINIEDCIIKNTVSSLGANGIKIQNKDILSSIEFNINRCVFSDNKITKKLFGIVNFVNYTSNEKNLKGSIANCVFYKNTGPSVYINQYKNGKTKLQIINSTFFGNNLGDIVKVPQEPDSQIEVILQNSIFYEQPGPLSAILQNTNSSDLKGFTFNHCLFSAPACKTTADTLGCGMGNIFGQYPKFVDSSTVQGLQLAPGSVAINAGRWDPGLSALDVLGQPRVQDCKVDLGAYESPSILNPADTLITKAQIRSTPVNMALGEIGIQQISGGFPPYQLRWENGDSSRVRSGLPAGQYQLIITDQQGCFKVYRYTVPFTTATRDVPHTQGQLSLVPNPLMAGQQLSLRYRDFLPGKWHLQVLDLTGKVVLQRSLVLQTNGETPLPATELPAGMYLLILQRNEAFLSTKMMVIDRQ